jgi:hypothetical protein
MGKKLDESDSAKDCFEAISFNLTVLNQRLASKGDISIEWPNHHEYIYSLKSLLMITQALNFQLESAIRKFEGG